MKERTSESTGMYTDIFFDAITFNVKPLNICEIDCTSKSIQPIKSLKIRGGIKSYFGLSTNPEEVQRMKNAGLDVRLIQGDDDIIRNLDELKEKESVRIIMVNYPKELKEKVMVYRKLARERGLDFRVYPSLNV
jgi:hypothetical protein